MQSVRYCCCRCHADTSTVCAVDTRNPVEAVTACVSCVNQHVDALTAEWPPVVKPHPLRQPWADTVQADGDQGGGPE